jgi:hypothetical protein
MNNREVHAGPLKFSWAQAAIITVLAMGLFVLYMFFDLREAPGQNLGTTKMGTVADFAHSFGLWYAVGFVALDAVLAVASAILMVQSYQMVRARLMAGRTGACTVGTGVVIGFGAFGCPGCTVPVLGTLGMTLAASSLPLDGLEFKIAALIIVALGFWWLRRRANRAKSPQD